MLPLDSISLQTALALLIVSKVDLSPLIKNFVDFLKKHPNCNDLKLELRLHLGKGLRKYKGRFEVVKRKDTGMYLRYLY